MPEERNEPDEPTKIPLGFDQAVEGLLGVKPKKHPTAGELRKKIARKRGLVEKHTRNAGSITGDDDAAEYSRKYYRGLARRAEEDKARFEAELKQLTDEAD